MSAVRAVAVAITRDPATVNGYVLRLRPALALFAVAYIVAMALVVRAGPGRRVAILGHAVLYLALSILAQALMIVVGVGTGWVVGPFGIEATLMNLLIGGLVIMRMTFSTLRAAPGHHRATGCAGPGSARTSSPGARCCARSRCS